MAEPDAAGPSPDGNASPRPKRSRPISIAEAVRQMERQRAPLVAEIERAARERRWIDAEFGLDEEAEPTAQPTKAVKATEAPTPHPKPESAGRPAFEVDPGEKLLAAMRQAFPGFKPTDRWWVHAERELKNAHHRSNPEGHRAFCSTYPHWSSKDLICHLEAEGRIRLEPTGRKHKRTVEGMDVHQWVMAMATKDQSFRNLSQREAEKLGPFGARSIGKSWAWIQMKEDLKTEADEAAEHAAAELADRHGEDEDVGGRRLSSTKSGIGIQRPAPEDLEHERAVKVFFAKAGQSDKKRTK